MTRNPGKALRTAHKKHAIWLALIFSTVLTLSLYGLSLQLPLFNDDIANLRLNAGLDLAGLFLRADLLPYYRPLSLVPQELSEVFLGGYSPVALHALNLILQVINGWLIWLLAQRAAPDLKAAAWITAALYLAFPFSYQVVPWVGTLCHLMATGGLLLALYFADLWWQSRRTLHLVIAWFSVAFACFSHENGVLVSGVLGVWLLLRFTTPTLESLHANLKRLLLAGLPALLIGVGYLLIWLGIPRNSDGFQPSLSSFSTNFAYLIQGLSYPVSQFGGLLERLVMPELAAVVLVNGLALILLSTLLVVARQRAAWIGLLIYGIAIVPAILFLAPTYVIDGARLMQMASVGGSLAWGLTIAHLLEATRPNWQRIGAALLTILVLGGSLFFIQTRMTLYRQLAPLYQAAIDGDRPTALINLPAWLAYRTEVYPLGSEGVTYYSSYFPFDLLVLYNRGDSYPVYVFDRADISPDPPRYYAGLIGPGPTDPARDVSLYEAEVVRWTTVIDDQWYWESSEQIEAVADGQRFENGIEAAITAEWGRAPVQLQIAWQASDPVAASAFVHVVCADQLVAQADGPPMAGMRPFETWAPGDAWQETRLIALPQGQQIDTCVLRLGLVDPAGERIPLVAGGEFIEIVPAMD